MNATITGCDDRMFDYKVEFRHARRSAEQPPATPIFRRRRRPPQLVNGMHRRRLRRFTW